MDTTELPVGLVADRRRAAITKDSVDEAIRSLQAVLAAGPADPSIELADGLDAWREEIRRLIDRAGRRSEDLARTIAWLDQVADDHGFQFGLAGCTGHPKDRPGAISWGCSCGKTADEQLADAVEFARTHD